MVTPMERGICSQQAFLSLLAGPKTGHASIKFIGLLLVNFPNLYNPLLCWISQWPPKSIDPVHIPALMRMPQE